VYMKGLTYTGATTVFYENPIGFTAFIAL
jgi:hypothetical protein